MPFMFDSTILLMIPPLLLSLYAQHKVKSTFEKYSNVPSRRRLSGAQVAAQLLAAAGIHDVKIEAVPGYLSDHYDPSAKAVRLSEAVYNKQSLAALGVAAHEVGHAVQHNTRYSPLAWRSGIFPLVNIGSKLAMPLIMIGIFLPMFAAGMGELGGMLLNAGIVLFSITVLFQLITLPVEFNASRRAMDMLVQQGILTHDETRPTKRVLDAAALTYVAAAIAAIMTLIRFILIARRN